MLTALQEPFLPNPFAPSPREDEPTPENPAGWYPEAPLLKGEVGQLNGYTIFMHPDVAEDLRSTGAMPQYGTESAEVMAYKQKLTSMEQEMNALRAMNRKCHTALNRQGQQIRSLEASLKLALCAKAPTLPAPSLVDQIKLWECQPEARPRAFMTEEMLRKAKQSGAAFLPPPSPGRPVQYIDEISIRQDSLFNRISQSDREVQRDLAAMSNRPQSACADSWAARIDKSFYNAVKTGIGITSLSLDECKAQDRFPDGTKI